MKVYYLSNVTVNVVTYFTAKSFEVEILGGKVSFVPIRLAYARSQTLIMVLQKHTDIHTFK